MSAGSWTRCVVDRKMQASPCIPPCTSPCIGLVPTAAGVYATPVRPSCTPMHRWGRHGQPLRTSLLMMPPLSSSPVRDPHSQPSTPPHLPSDDAPLQVIPGIGLAVTLYDVQSIEGGFIYPRCEEKCGGMCEDVLLLNNVQSTGGGIHLTQVCGDGHWRRRG